MGHVCYWTGGLHSAAAGAELPFADVEEFGIVSLRFLFVLGLFWAGFDLVRILLLHSSMGFDSSTFNSNMLAIPSAVLQIILMLLLAFSSDYFGERTLFVSLPFLLSTPSDPV